MLTVIDLAGPLGIRAPPLLCVPITRSPCTSRLHFARSGGFAKTQLQSRALQTSMAGVPEEIIRFHNEHGEELVGWLRDAGSKDNAVILCHGYMSNATHCHFERLAAALAAKGVTSLRFDHAMALQGSSERRRPFVSGNYAEEVREIQAAVRKLEELGYRVGCLVGHSKGGFNVFLYGATVPDVPPRIVSVSGRFKMDDGVFGRFGPDILDQLLAQGGSVHRKEANGFEWDLTYQDLKQRLDLDVPALARAWPAQSELVLVHGTGDATIPWQEAAWLQSLAPRASTVWVEGADHNYTRHAAELEREVLRAVLGAAAADSSTPA